MDRAPASGAGNAGSIPAGRVDLMFSDTQLLYYRQKVPLRRFQIKSRPKRRGYETRKNIKILTNRDQYLIINMLQRSFYRNDKSCALFLCKKDRMMIEGEEMADLNAPAGGNKMAVMPVPKLLLNMSFPLMLSLVFQSLYNIVDSIFVARISESALTATSLAYPVQILMIAAATGTAAGVSALLSRLVGSGRPKEASRGAVCGLLLAVLTSFIFIILGIFASSWFVSLFTDDTQTALMCTQYLKIVMIFCTGNFIEIMGQRLLQSVGKTVCSMISLICSACTNIILDPILIFGLFGLPALGIRGAAIATVIGQWVGAAVVLLLNKYKNKDISLKIKGFKFDKRMAAAIYKVGLPTMLTQAMGSIMNASMNAVLISFSSTAVAFFGVYFKLQNFLFMPINGIGQAVLPIAGFNYGSKSKSRLKQLVKTALPAAAAVGLIGTAIFCAIPGPLLKMFSAGSDMLSLGIPALRIISPTFALGAVTVVAGYFSSGLGNGINNMLGVALRQVVILIPCVIIFARTLGIDHVWYAFWISESIAFAVSVLLFSRTYKKRTANM